MKRTKIVATIGPASASYENLKALAQAGMNVARLNFSHGSYEDHQQVIDNVRKLNDELGLNIAMLADLQGPKIRLGEIKGGEDFLEDGQEFVLTNEVIEGDKNKAYLSYENFPMDVKPGEIILLDDHLKVISSDKKKEVKTKVLYGGPLLPRKGVNLPNTNISLPCLTEKDLKDLDFVLSQDLDWIGLSFVRSARDIIELRHIIRNNAKTARIVAKIEKPEAIDDIDDIIKESDALMVARGDLGVEIPMEEVPLTQKLLIRKATKHAKPVIVATQMMESMIINITPTRAEVNDVANAVFDGADAVMLSGETSVGKYPVQVIENMAKILVQVEKYDELYNHEEAPEKNHDRFITDSICFNAVRLTKRIEADAIITMTHSVYTAYKISSQRPKARIFIFTGNKAILTQLNLVWGVEAFYYDKMVSTDHTIADIKYLLKKNGKLNEGDLVVNITSIPISEHGNSNMLKLSYVD